MVPDPTDKDNQLPPLADAVKLVLGLADTLMDCVTAVLDPAVPVQDKAVGVAVNVFLAETVNETGAR